MGLGVGVVGEGEGAEAVAPEVRRLLAHLSRALPPPAAAATKVTRPITCVDLDPPLLGLLLQQLQPQTASVRGQRSRPAPAPTRVTAATAPTTHDPSLALVATHPQRRAMRASIEAAPTATRMSLRLRLLLRPQAGPTAPLSPRAHSSRRPAPTAAVAATCPATRWSACSSSLSTVRVATTGLHCPGGVAAAQPRLSPPAPAAALRQLVFAYKYTAVPELDAFAELGSRDFSVRACSSQGAVVLPVSSLVRPRRCERVPAGQLPEAGARRRTSLTCAVRRNTSGLSRSVHWGCCCCCTLLCGYRQF